MKPYCGRCIKTSKQLSCAVVQKRKAVLNGNGSSINAVLQGKEKVVRVCIVSTPHTTTIAPITTSVSVEEVAVAETQSVQGI